MHTIDPHTLETPVLDHDKYHELTIELLQSIDSSQPVLIHLMAKLDTYVSVLVIYSSIMSTILSVAALLILYKMYQSGE